MGAPGRDLSRKQKITLFVVGMLLFWGGVVVAETFTGGFNTAGAGGEFNASEGPLVKLGNTYELRGGQPATSRSINVSTESNGWINVSAQAGEDTNPMAVTIDEINGTWTNVSAVNSPDGNITLQPSDKNFTRIGGGIDTFKFKEAKVNDEQVDLRYSADSTATIVVETNATDGTQYGLVNAETNEGLDVAVAGSNGVIAFTAAPSTTGEVKVRIEELGTLEIREETDPYPLIDSATAEVTFYQDVQNDPEIVRRTTNDGTIDLTGLPVDEQFSVSIQAPNHHNRTVIIDDLSQQQTVFLINTSESTIENRFTVEDRTGNFPPDETEIRIQKAINRTVYGGDPPDFGWINVAGDDIGADEAFTTDLIEDDRYRIVVSNEDGDTRILGAYTAETTGTINLRIGNVVLDPEETPQPSYQINRTNATGQAVMVHFEYNDSRDNTGTIWLEIYEYNNQSNVLLTNTSFLGPFGTFSHTETVPSGENETTWVVKFTAEISGQDNIQGRVIVGPNQPVIPELPGWLVSFIFVGTIWVTAGLFSQLNGDIGALIVAGMGAIFFFVDLVPSQLGGGVLVLAMITAGLMFIRERRGGGF